MTAVARQTLEETLGHRFAAPQLMEEALLVAKPGTGTRVGFERLEFLGDRVLGLVVAHVLVERFPTEPEGGLAKRLSALVRREALVDVAQRIGLPMQLVGDAGAPVSEGRVADAVEALIAAVFLDGGLAAARRMIETHWAPLFARYRHAPQDAKTALQEWAQGRGLALPRYRLVAATGPDHAPVFTVEVLVAGLVPESGNAGSKQAAEQAAAERLLTRLAAS